MNKSFPFQFNYIPYPLWRRRYPLGIGQVLNSLYPALYPVQQDRQPPTSSADVAQFLHHFRLLPHSTADAIEAITPPIADPMATTLPDIPQTKVRLVAQWEQMEAILISWGILYPPLWTLHAQMVAHIVPVAQAHIIVPNVYWAKAIWAYLQDSGILGGFAHNVRFILIPTDDIWVRDYGPMLGYAPSGERCGVNAIYDHLPYYPQKRDNALPDHWSAHTQTPLIPLNLHTEGGNLLTDGEGTLFMTEKVLTANPHFKTREALEAYLHTILDYEKLILTPRMAIERTGHIDLLIKLIDRKTVLVSVPASRWDKARLDKVLHIFHTETNAKGEPFRVVELPTPPLYLNWLVYPIRRSYTNALTVNGRILLPIYQTKTDALAIQRYTETAQGYEVIPLDCSVAINGGGSIHCMTREVPALR